MADVKMVLYVQWYLQYMLYVLSKWWKFLWVPTSKKLLIIFFWNIWIFNQDISSLRVIFLFCLSSTCISKFCILKYQVVKFLEDKRLWLLRKQKLYTMSFLSCPGERSGVIESNLSHLLRLAAKPQSPWTTKPETIRRVWAETSVDSYFFPMSTKCFCKKMTLKFHRHLLAYKMVVACFAIYKI